MQFETIALNKGNRYHIKLNDGQMITDVMYDGDVDNCGKRFQLFIDGKQVHMFNPSYIMQIIRTV